MDLRIPPEFSAPPDDRDDILDAPLTVREWAVLAVIGIAAFALGASIMWGLSYLPSLLVRAAQGAAYYLDVGPGCPGADYGWLGRCAEAPKGGVQ